MQVCPRCARENENEVRFCGRCGLDFAEYAKHQARPTTDETRFCYKHPKEATNLSCGRCDKPLCTKCAQIGSAGPRCPECAKHNIEFRPAAVLHTATSNIKGLARLGPWGIYILVFCAISIFGFIRSSCNSPATSEPPAVEREN